jgi:hypothetical protein
MRLADLCDLSRRGKAFPYLLRDGLAWMDPDLRHSERHGGVHQMWALELTRSSLWPVTMTRRLSVVLEEVQNGWGG